MQKSTSANLLKGHTVLTVLRHPNSLKVVQEFVEANGGQFLPIVLDPVELPAGEATAIADLRNAVPQASIIVAGTKVYDHVKEGPSELFDFLKIIQEAGAGNKPVCLTHLTDFDAATKAQLSAGDLNVLYVENDNLGRDGMANLGPLLLQAAALQHNAVGAKPTNGPQPA